MLRLGLGLGLVSGSSLVGVSPSCGGRVDYIHDGHVHDGRVCSGSVEYTRRSCQKYAGTTVVSVT